MPRVHQWSKCSRIQQWTCTDPFQLSKGAFQWSVQESNQVQWSNGPVQWSSPMVQCSLERVWCMCVCTACKAICMSSLQASSTTAHCTLVMWASGVLNMNSSWSHRMPIKFDEAKLFPSLASPRPAILVDLSAVGDSARASVINQSTCHQPEPATRTLTTTSLQTSHHATVMIIDEPPSHMPQSLSNAAYFPDATRRSEDLLVWQTYMLHFMGGCENCTDA